MTERIGHGNATSAGGVNPDMPANRASYAPPGAARSSATSASNTAASHTVSSQTAAARSPKPSADPAPSSAMFQHTRQNRRPVPAAPGGRWGHVYAALDLGTNNCRLLIAKPRRGGFTVIDAFSRTVCLGESMGATGAIQPEAIERTMIALQTCMNKMERRGVTVARSIATEACRTAANGAAFVERVRRETGLVFDIISPAEEARLAATGCWPLVDRDSETVLVFDIGGGSTELIWLDMAASRDRKPGQSDDRPKIAAWTSIPCGVVSLTERFGHPHLEPDDFKPMADYVMGHLEPFTGADHLRPAFERGAVHLLGTSGTVTTIAGLQMGLERYERDKVDGTWMTMDRVTDTCRVLASRSFSQRSELPCVGMDRADFVLAGCAILDAIHRLWPTERLRVADRGLREGMLLSLMAQADKAARRSRRGRRSGRPAGRGRA